MFFERLTGAPSIPDVEMDQGGVNNWVCSRILSGNPRDYGPGSGTSEIPLDIETGKYIIIFTPHRCAVFVPQKFFETYFERPLD